MGSGQKTERIAVITHQPFGRFQPKRQVRRRITQLRNRSNYLRTPMRPAHEEGDFCYEPVSGSGRQYLCGPAAGSQLLCDGESTSVRSCGAGAPIRDGP